MGAVRRRGWRDAGCGPGTGARERVHRPQGAAAQICGLHVRHGHRQQVHRRARAPGGVLSGALDNLAAAVFGARSWCTPPCSACRRWRASCARSARGAGRRASSSGSDAPAPAAGVPLPAFLARVADMRWPVRPLASARRRVPHRHVRPRGSSPHAPCPRGGVPSGKEKAPPVLNCLPFLGQREMGGILMRTDLRVKHDIGVRGGPPRSSAPGAATSPSPASSPSLGAP